MSDSSNVRFTKGDIRCPGCGFAIKYEVSESPPRQLKSTEVPCSGCARDYQLEVVGGDQSSFRVKIRDFTER